MHTGDHPVSLLTHIHICTHTHLCVCLYVSVRLRVCMSVCVRVCGFVCVCVYVRVYVFLYEYVHTHICTGKLGLIQNHMFDEIMEIHNTQITLNEQAGRVLRSTSNQSSKPCAIVQYRVAKTHRMPYLFRSFSAKEFYNSWLYCGKRPAT